MGHYRRVAETGAPAFGTTTVPTVNGDPFTYAFAIFPLSTGGDSVAQFIALEDYGDFEPRLSSSLGDPAPWQDQQARAAALAASKK
ncbi:MAG: hypothetical protein IPK59_02615 [Rhodospirillaceae bacterium]|nr:hypothetical protein [Rhodospirillaceae bacterium]